MGDSETIGNSSASAWSRVDMSKPHPARTYDFWLGGKDNFVADREHAERVAGVFPSIRTAAIENRKFLGRAVRHLAEVQGIRQFLDIGTGLPTANNTHQVAQSVHPDARVVYVDNDPLVLAHARALLTSATDAGVTAYIDADARQPETILRDPDLAATLDLARPVGLVMVAVLHFVTDDDVAYEVVQTFVDAIPSGSYVIMSHSTLDGYPPEKLADADAVIKAGPPLRMRSLPEFRRFFDGLDIIEPGIVSVVDWRPDDDSAPRPPLAEVAVYGGVARKP